MTLEAALVAAHEALRASELARAAEHLRAAWASTRLPALADRLDWLERRLRRESPASAFEHDDAGLELEAHADAAWIEAAAKHDDPRLTTLLVEMLHEPPHLRPREDGNGVEQFWSAVLDALELLRDARAVAPLRAFAKRVRVLAVEADREALDEVYALLSVGPWLEHDMGKLADRLDALPKPTASAEASVWLERIDVLLAAERQLVEAEAEARIEREHTRRRLREAVAAAPDDDAPRRAYATWLIERGDAYGHFIRAQLGDPAQAPWDDEAAMLADSRLRWAEELGPLASDVAYERGFPVTVTLASAMELEDHHIDDVGWATVRRIDGSYCWRWGELPEHAALLRSPRLRGLRCLDGTSPTLLVALRDDALPLTTIGFDPSAVRDWDALCSALEGYPALRTLHLAAYDELDPSHVGRVGAGASRWRHLAFSVQRGLPNVGMLLDVLAGSECEVVDVYWGSGSGLETDWLQPTATFRARFVRDGRGALSVARVEHRPPEMRYFDMGSMVAVLDALPAHALTRFELVVPPGSGWLPHPGALQACQEALSRFPLSQAPGLPEPYRPEVLAREHLAALSSPNELTVRLALDELTSLRLPAARGPIAEVLRGATSDAVGWAAVRALVPIADASVVPELCEALAAADSHLGAAIAELLGSLFVPESLACIESFARRSEKPEAQLGGLAALAMQGDPRGIPVAREVLRARLDALVDDSAEPLRRRACDTLGMLGAVEARDDVLELYHRGDVYDRRAAVTALGLLGVREDVEIVARHRDADDLYPPGRSLLAYLLLEPDGIGPRSAETMARCLDGWSSSDAAETIAWSLLQLAARVSHERAEWSAVARAVCTWCGRERRALRASWLGEARVETRYSLALVERIAEAWTR